MAYFHTNVLDNQIKALPTIDTASGSVASFDTDLTENLIECVCTLPYNANGYNEVSLFVNSINIWDEQCEQGAIDSSGNNATDPQRIRPVGYILVKPSTTYYCVAPTNLDVYFYDANKTFILVQYTRNNRNFTTPSNCKYIKFRCGGSNYPLTPTTYGHDISFNYPSTDTEYHAFNGVVEDFNTTIYGGEIDLVTGTLTDKYNADGTEKTPVIINLNGNSITLDIENTIYNNCGDTSVKFLLTVGKKIA